ncbi:tail fiber protein [Parasutterella excrementihominis]|uniref:tail fiber protein n=2 Tax=Parasutterella excrementihominis TaxID=487175 RepID=UPI00242C1D95|nr:tail fiber protein [Parasutterella excrementihominis]
MTTINEFLPFADQSNANLIPYAEWVSAAKRLTGFVSGIAKSNEMNRVWAQGAQAGYAIAKFIERTLNEDVYVADGERLADQFYRSIVQMSYRATPIGCVLTFPVHVEIDGYVATNNGGNLSQTTYDQLYAVYGTKFNTSSTLATQFGIPDMAHRVFEAAATLEEIGCYVAAGLPNIEGYLNSANLGNIDAGYVLSWNGALRPNRVRNGRIVATQENNNYVITDDANFDASKSNALFGSSDTNQPKSLRALCLIRAYQA